MNAKKELDFFYHHYHNSVFKFKHVNWSLEKISLRYSAIFEVQCDFIQNFSSFVFQHDYLFLQLGLFSIILIWMLNSLTSGLIDEKLTSLEKQDISLERRIFDFAINFIHDLLIATCFVPTIAIIYPGISLFVCFLFSVASSFDSRTKFAPILLLNMRMKRIGFLCLLFQSIL